MVFEEPRPKVEQVRVVNMRSSTQQNLKFVQARTISRMTMIDHKLSLYCTRAWTRCSDKVRSRAYSVFGKMERVELFYQSQVPVYMNYVYVKVTFRKESSVAYSANGMGPIAGLVTPLLCYCHCFYCDTYC